MRGAPSVREAGKRLAHVIVVLLAGVGAFAGMAFADRVTPPLEGGRYYTGCGERFYIDGCGGTQDTSYAHMSALTLAVSDLDSSSSRPQ
jgi:hypothetical protein